MSNQLTDVRKGGGDESVDSEAGVLDEPDSAKPAQRSCRRGPPAGLADYEARLKLPPLLSVEGLQRYTVHSIV